MLKGKKGPPAHMPDIAEGKEMQQGVQMVPGGMMENMARSPSVSVYVWDGASIHLELVLLLALSLRVSYGELMHLHLISSEPSTALCRMGSWGKHPTQQGMSNTCKFPWEALME